MIDREVKLIAFRCPPDLIQSIKLFASENEQTVSGVVRLAIKRHIGYGKKSASRVKQAERKTI